MSDVNQQGAYVNAHTSVNGDPDHAPFLTATSDELYKALAPFARYDGPDTNWALRIWCEALVGTTRLDDIVQVAYDQDVIPDIYHLDGVRPGWSSLLDVDEAPTWALPWLAQMAGVRTLPGADVPTQRAEIRAHVRWNRGTPSAILTAAAAHMKPGANITLRERDTGPYHATLKLYQAQLSAMTYTEIQQQYPTIAAFRAAYATYSAIPGSAALVAAVNAVKPAGILLTVSFLDFATYADIQTAYPTIAAFRAAFATYTAVKAWIPPA